MSEDIGHVHGRYRIEVPVRMFHRGMVEGGGYYDGLGQPPEPQQVSAHLRVGGTEYLALRFGKLNPFSRREHECRAVFFGEIRCKHQFPHIVKQPRKESRINRLGTRSGALLGARMGCIRLRSGDPLGSRPDGHRRHPELGQQ